LKRPPAVSSPRPKWRKRPRLSLCATSNRWVALTRWFFRRESWPSEKSRKRLKSHSLTSSPRMASPRNSSRSLSVGAGGRRPSDRARLLRSRWSYGLRPGRQGVVFELIAKGLFEIVQFRWHFAWRRMRRGLQLVHNRRVCFRRLLRLALA